jgi:hypothetical protein
MCLTGSRHDVTEAGDFLFEGLHALGQQVGQQPGVQIAQDVVQVADAGNGFGHIEAIGLGEVDVWAKAQFQDQEWVIQQVGPPAWRGEEMFLDPDQGRFDIGTLGMPRIAWPALTGRIDRAPVKESEPGAIALHDGVNLAHLIESRLVKRTQNGYHSTHEGCSWQSE